MTGVASRYRIVRRLGQGGMAEVFEAELLGELGFVRKVAIKQLSPEALRDPIAARRFIDESRIASRLHHAGIVAVLDVGLLDDRPFQVLELVDGLDAQALVARVGGALPVELALVIAHAVAQALEHAHTAVDADGRLLGIVHRDVKPPNILVAWTGDVKLADFGIAIAHDRAAHTETGAVAGTRGFISPEQRTRAQLDGRSDVFALGLTLHALCTGDSPLSELTAEIRLLGGEPLALDPALPADVRGLIARAVMPDRRDRPTAGQLAHAIGEALASRGARDGRSAMRALMASLRAAPRRAGALDALLGVDLVPVGEPDGVVQRFATELRPSPAPVPPAPSSEPEGPATAPRAHAGRPAVPRRWRALALLGTAALALAVLAVIRTSSSPAASAPAPVVASAVLDVGAAPTGGPVDAAVTGVPGDVVVASAPADAARAPSAAPPSRAHVASPWHRPTEPAASAPSADAEHGYVQVVGEELLRARVFIDGVAVGYVPNRFAVAVGHHRIEVERPDGTRLPPRELDVTGFHTASHPARPSW